MVAVAVREVDFLHTDEGAAWQRAHFAAVLAQLAAGYSTPQVAQGLDAPAADVARRFVGQMQRGLDCRKALVGKLAALHPPPGLVHDQRVPVTLALLADMEASLQPLNPALRALFVTDAQRLASPPVVRQLATLK